MHCLSTELGTRLVLTDYKHSLPLDYSNRVLEIKGSNGYDYYGYDYDYDYDIDGGEDPVVLDLGGEGTRNIVIAERNTASTSQEWSNRTTGF